MRHKPSNLAVLLETIGKSTEDLPQLFTIAARYTLNADAPERCNARDILSWKLSMDDTLSKAKWLFPTRYRTYKSLDASGGSASRNLLGAAAGCFDSRRRVNSTVRRLPVWDHLQYMKN